MAFLMLIVLILLEELERRRLHVTREVNCFRGHKNGLQLSDYIFLYYIRGWIVFTIILLIFGER